MEAEAHSGYTPNEEGELGFKAGDLLILLDYGHSTTWYDARANDRVGQVPSNYINVIETSWYFGRISRVAAERLLSSSPYEGAFLVRLSESSPRDFSLSVKCNNSVQHFRILKDKREMYCLWGDGPAFYSINKLVEHYQHETVSRSRSIFLCTMENADPPTRSIVQAIYNFNADPDNEETKNELHFQEGDMIWVYNDEDREWWLGNIGVRSGFFPKSYVKPITLDSLTPKDAVKES